MRSRVTRANERLRKASANQLDLGTAAFATFMGLAAVQIIRGSFLPAGLTMVSIGIGILNAHAESEGDEPPMLHVSEEDVAKGPLQ
jgi:hypothetical protein